MSRNAKPAITPADVFHILRANPRRWIVPTVAGLVLAVAYAVLHHANWDASQALMVRDETMGATVRPGKFQQPDEMKTVQETILELARSRTVLSAALAEVGSPESGVGSRPTDAAVVTLQSHVKLVPPKGAEFGKTEVFYLNVEAETRSRAIALAGAICQQLQARSQELRDQKAQSLIAELGKTADLAKTDLNTTTAALTAVESRIGADLGELRVLNEMGGGDSPLRRSINEIDQELRQARQAIDANRELLSILESSKTDARSLSAAPNRLLEAQPVLRRLKDGLVDAQLRTAQFQGNLTKNHPTVIAAKISESEIAEHVKGEIESAIAGVQAELTLSQERADLLESQLTSAHDRLAKLADMRADYSNLVAERNQRADILKTAEQQLAEARASQAAAKTASLIAAIDAPIGSDSPVGPGKAAIALGGLLGGLIIGLGIVFLTVQPVQSELTSIEVITFEQMNSNAIDLNGYAAMARNGHAVNGHALNDHSINGHFTNGRGLSLKQALQKVAMA